MHGQRIFLVLLTLLSALAQALPSWGGEFLTLTFNLEQMCERADRIFVGKVMSVQEEYISAAGGTLPVTVYSFEVEETFKGSVGSTLMIRQVGHRSDPSSLFGKGLPVYDKGQVLMLFLHGDSQIGLTSPVGLGQGAFRVKMDGPSKVSVRNSRGNQHLLEGSDRIDMLLRTDSSFGPYALKTAKGDLPYKGFRSMVLSLLQP